MTASNAGTLMERSWLAQNQTFAECVSSCNSNNFSRILRNVFSKAWRSWQRISTAVDFVGLQLGRRRGRMVQLKEAAN
jgi:hypothetical protein